MKNIMRDDFAAKSQMNVDLEKNLSILPGNP
jgi:hypothetical protein